ESLGHHVAESAPEGMFEPGFASHFNTIIAADTETAFQAFEAVLGGPIAEGDIEPRNAHYRRAGQALTAVTYLQARQWLGTWSRPTAGRTCSSGGPASSNGPRPGRTGTRRCSAPGRPPRPGRQRGPPLPVSRSATGPAGHRVTGSGCRG